MEGYEILALLSPDNNFVAALAQVTQSALLVLTVSSIAQLKWNQAFSSSCPVIDINRLNLASRSADGSLRLLRHFALRQ